VEPLAISVRRATCGDAAALAGLVNRAFAIEASFVDGDRTDPDEIARLIASGTFVVLERPGGLAAAVYVERGYLGLLSVAPEMQGRGLGTRLVRIAEALAEAAGDTTMQLKIINLREELARWYRSLGYREVGTEPYHHPAVRRPCHFVWMQRRLGGSTAAAA
jgi:ribosomal protein S18 acetylase RimI-like enzyme